MPDYPVPDRHPTDLNDIVDAVLKLYMELSQAQNITVEKQASSIPLLSLDREQMERAVGNLVKNAIEAMPDGGTLTLWTYATSSNNGNLISLEVQDNGHGMSEETRKHLFTTRLYHKSLWNRTRYGNCPTNYHRPRWRNSSRIGREHRNNHTDYL